VPVERRSSGKNEAREGASADIVALAIVNALLTVIAIYAGLRTHEALFRVEPNPATVIWSAHVAVYWRIAIGAYVAVPVALFAAFCARRDRARVARVTSALVPIVASAIALQAAIFP
jgi:hypothetical protein